MTGNDRNTAKLSKDIQQIGIPRVISLNSVIFFFSLGKDARTGRYITVHSSQNFRGQDSWLEEAMKSMKMMQKIFEFLLYKQRNETILLSSSFIGLAAREICNK
jgi:hypothetical protein